MTWTTVALMAQTLLYTAGTVAFVLLVLLGYQNNARMQQAHDRAEQAHAAMMKDHRDALKDHERFMQSR